VDYQLENLDPEGFQYLVQALVVKEYPHVQCFPVAQPDGGRDAISIRIPNARATEAEMVVFQVKYSRNPWAKDEHKELEKLLKDEAPKIKKLLPRGVKEFVLVTNIPGTAHLDTGSIDRVNALLAQYMPCPAYVWWRNDLNRRLDEAWNIKWSYPQVMSGTDVMRSLIENGMGEHKERRIDAIKSFLLDQYLAEEEVKFKQIHLQNKLLDLFIDVPIVGRVSEGWIHRSGGSSRSIAIHAMPMYRTMAGPEEELSDSEARVGTGASTVIFNESGSSYLTSMVLEGAPGQGKSTITQYVAQVYRMRLLHKDDELAKIEQRHRGGIMRLPIKVDLRDFASWLSKKHPFDATNDLPVPEKWQKNLESFLVFLIGYYSQNLDFNATDFQAIIKTSSILLLFDGLDEVAEISQRKDVVEEIVRGTRKLRELAASLQTVVTSRPAAFANSPGMPRDSFVYFRLGPLPKPLITSYAEKWMTCQHMTDREKVEVRTILKHKLDEPHIKELARNPMQLSILLGLIRSRGASLPDKRTALYEQYVDLFFSRESEKSPIIRDHRDLVIELHRYVAWYLHSDAQLRKGNGSISAENLRKLLVKYLRKECRDEALADKLFSGMVERVVALVSRVQGTYEFEVQPLREFFAAKYLFESAATSPASDGEPGARPDVFDAIAKDFHWLNVTRFFAGCYNKGELPSLIDRLEELTSLDDYKYLNHPRLLTATLLGDWVFAPNVRTVRDALTLIVQGTGLRYFISSQKSDVTLQLPNENGREGLVEKCFTILSTHPPLDYANDLLRVIEANTSGQEALTYWHSHADSETGKKLTKWLRYGLHLGLLAKLPVDTLTEHLEDDAQLEERVRLFIKARRWDALESTERIYRQAVHYTLTSGENFGAIRTRKNSSSLERFISLVNLAKYFNLQLRSSNEKLEEVWLRSGIGQGKAENEIPSHPTYPITTKCNNVSALAEQLAKLPVSNWHHMLAPFDELTHAIVQEFGNVWIVNLFALRAAAYRVADPSTKDNELFDSSKSICQRVRYAAEHRGGVAWWNKQLDSIESNEDTMLFLLILFTWATPAVVKSVLPSLDQLLDDLPTKEWYKLFDAIRANMWEGPGQRNKTKSQELVDALPKNASARTVLCVGVRITIESEHALYQARLLNYSGHDRKILAVCQWFAGHMLFSKPSDPSPYLSLLKRGYRQEAEQSDFGLGRAMRDWSPPLDLSVAKTIAANPEEYPSFLLKAAEQVCQTYTASQVVPVGTVARNEKWTFA
jgi:hypothetical protein